jgi:tRNA/rRNA methyltransferase
MKRWTIILVSPKEPGNVGGAARVLRNFGGGGLRVVDPRCEVNGPDARRFSSGAADLLRSAPQFPTLREAVADFELAIGLTGVSGRHHRLDCVGLLPSAILAGKDHLARCALVFGREERGMETEEMEACTHLWSLPTNPDFPSLNLAQAIGVTLSAVAEVERQLGLTDLGRGVAPSSRSVGPLAGGHEPGDQPATVHELDLLAENFRSLMQRTGWDEGRRLLSSLGKLRHVLARASATQREVNLFHGICRQALNALDHPDRFPSHGETTSKEHSP